MGNEIFVDREHRFYKLSENIRAYGQKPAFIIALLSGAAYFMSDDLGFPDIQDVADSVAIGNIWAYLCNSGVRLFLLSQVTGGERKFARVVKGAVNPF